MVETRRGTAVEPEVGKSYKEATVAGPSTGLTARAGPAGRGRAARGLRLGNLDLSAAQLYTLLGLAHAALAVPLIFGWRQAAKAAFGSSADPPEDQHGHLLQLYASGLASSAAVIFSLEELARRRLLHSFTADVLKMGLIGHGLAWFALMMYYPATLSALAFLVEGVASAATAALPASHLLATREDRARVGRDLRRLPAAARSFLLARPRRGWLSALYSLLTVAFVAAGATYFVAPRFTLFHTFGYDYGKSTQLVWKAIGAGALMTVMPALTVALKHKADIDLMAATPARTLNAGLLATSVGHLLVLGPVLAKGNGGVMLPGVIGTWVLAMLTAMLGLSAPELAEMAEEVAAEATRRD